MGDPRRNDLMLLFSLAALPMAGCTTGVEDGGGTVFSPTVGNASQNGSQTAGDDDTGDDDGDTGGGDDGSASGPNGTTITTAADDTGGGPSSASITNPSTDPTNASMTYGGTYGGTYGATYGGSYGSYGGSYGSYGSGGGMLPPVCQQFVSNYVDCIPEAAPYADQIGYYCADDLMYAAMAGGACGSALEEFYACMSMADCAELTGGDPCGASQLDGVCGGG